ncbi:MAG: hypothetical protein LBJ08_01460 [Bifidobacteriaceae bacterium]|jgi:hypothetical protein|nr:hypothetical protein [Bifidobacteriaceae bacterium]
MDHEIIEDRFGAGRNGIGIIGRIDRCAIADLMSQLNIRNVVLNYARGYIDSDLRDLQGLGVARLELVARTVTDIDELYEGFEELRVLSLMTPLVRTVNLEQLSQLEDFSGEWYQIKGSVGAVAGLRKLWVLHYTELNLRALSGNPALELVQMKDYPRVASFRGLDELPRLESLCVYLARRLTRQGIVEGGGSTRMRELAVDTCRKIDSLDWVVEYPSLEELNTGNCGDLASAKPLASLVHLRRLIAYESTRFLDGDLSPIAVLTNLELLAIMSRKQYRPSTREIQAMIEDRLNENGR